MAVIPIRTLGDPVLREPGRDVEVFDAALRSLIGDMFETMYAAPGVGLAAPQIGLAIRLFVFDAGDEEGEQRGVVANPVLSRMKGELLEDEGCLSIPGVYRPTPRALTVRVDAASESARKAVEAAGGRVETPPKRVDAARPARPRESGKAKA